MNNKSIDHTSNKDNKVLLIAEIANRLKMPNQISILWLRRKTHHIRIGYNVRIMESDI